MAVTSEVRGRFKLKGAERREREQRHLQVRGAHVAVSFSTYAFADLSV